MVAINKYQINGIFRYEFTVTVKVFIYAGG